MYKLSHMATTTNSMMMCNCILYEMKIMREICFSFFNLIGSIFPTSSELLRRRISQNRQSVVRCRRAGEITPIIYRRNSKNGLHK